MCRRWVERSRFKGLLRIMRLSNPKRIVKRGHPIHIWSASEICHGHSYHQKSCRDISYLLTDQGFVSILHQIWLQHCLGIVNQRRLQAQQILAELESKEWLKLRWKLEVWSLDPKAVMLKVGTSFGIVRSSSRGLNNINNSSNQPGYIKGDRRLTGTLFRH